MRMMSTKLGGRYPLRSALSSLVLLVLLSGCAAPGGVRDIEDGYRLSKQSTNGLLIASLSYSRRDVVQTISIDSPNRDMHYVLGLNKAFAFHYAQPGDFDELGLKGHLFAVELPAGRYAVVRWGITGKRASVSPANPIDLAFEIKPGEPLYLGNFHFEQKWGFYRRLLGGWVRWADLSKRDLAKFRSKYRNVPLERVYIGMEPGLIVEGLGGASNANPYATPLYVPMF